MNNLRNRATETIYTDLIFAYSIAKGQFKISQVRFAESYLTNFDFIEQQLDAFRALEDMFLDRNDFHTVLFKDVLIVDTVNVAANHRHAVSVDILFAFAELTSDGFFPLVV